ncbi:hypothetical protein BsWGS_06991 [Bradybaena similaris]
MSGRGGKRRQVLQLGSASKLHRYGYSKGFHTSEKKGRASLPILVGNYSNSDSEDSEETEEQVATDVKEDEGNLVSDTPDVAGKHEQPADMDDELKNFLSEIEAIPVTAEMATTEQSPVPMEDVKTEPEKAPEADLDDESHIETDEEAQKPTPKPKQSSHHYSMFVKGESEFVHSPKPEDVSSPVVAKEEDIPDEPVTNWQMVKDENTHYYYYWNIVTNEVTWEIPTEYTQYLLLHREYEEKMARYTPEQQQKLKEKHTTAAGDGPRGTPGDSVAHLAGSKHADISTDFHSSASLTTQGLDGRLSAVTLNTGKIDGGVRETSRSRSVSPRPETSQDSKHHKHKKEKKSHHKKKHKRRHDDSPSDEDAHSAKVSESKKPSVLSSESSTVTILAGSRLTSIVPYLSDQDDSDEDHNVDPVPQMGSASVSVTDSQVKDHKESPTHQEKPINQNPPQLELVSTTSQDSQDLIAKVAFHIEPTKTTDVASPSSALVLTPPRPPLEKEEATEDQTIEDDSDLKKDITHKLDQPLTVSNADQPNHKTDTDPVKCVIDSAGLAGASQLDDLIINKIMSAIVDPDLVAQAADTTVASAVTKSDPNVDVTPRIKEPIKIRHKEVIDMFAEDFPMPVPAQIKDIAPVDKGNVVTDDHAKNILESSGNVMEQEEILEMIENGIHKFEKGQTVYRAAPEASLEGESKIEECSLEKVSKTKEDSLEKNKTQENSLEKASKTQENSLEKKSKTEEISLQKKSKTEETNLEKKSKTEETSLEKKSKTEETSLEKKSKTEEIRLEKKSKTEEIRLEKKSKTDESSLERKTKTEDTSLERKSKTEENNLEKRSKVRENNVEKRSKRKESSVEKKSHLPEDHSEKRSKSKNRSREDSVEKSRNKTQEKSKSRTRENSSEKNRSKTPENSLVKSRSKTHSNSSEKNRSKTYENGSEKNRSKTSENSSEKIRNKTQENSSDKSKHKVRENSSEKIKGKTQENGSEKSRKRPHENISENKSSFVEQASLKIVNIVGYASDDEEEGEVRETVINKDDKQTHTKKKDKKVSKRHRKDSKTPVSSSADKTEKEPVSIVSAELTEVASEISQQVSEKQTENVCEDHEEDVDFDIDDIDRALEVALEKKLEKKKIELQRMTDDSKDKVKDEAIDSVSLEVAVAGQVLPNTPAVQTKGSDTVAEIGCKLNSAPDTLKKVASDNKMDESSQLEDFKLVADIRDMAELALSKLEFLDISTDNLSRLQVLFIELQTRFTDWSAGGLSTQYFHEQLKTAEQLLEQYELSAVPEGWACQWDRSNSRYYYRNKVTNSIQWEYPELDNKADVEAAEPAADNSDESMSQARERGSDEHHRSRSSGGSRHRKKDDKEKSKRDRHSSSRHYHRKRRRGRDHSNSSDSSSDSQQYRRHRKSKKKKRHRSERSPSVEIIEHTDDNLDGVEIIDAPEEPTRVVTPQSANSSPSAAVPPASPAVVDASTTDEHANAADTEGGPDVAQSGIDVAQSGIDVAQSGIDAALDGLDTDVDGFPLQSGEDLPFDEGIPEGEHVDTSEEVVVNPAVISKPPQIVIAPHLVAALNADTNLAAELFSANQIGAPAQASFYPSYLVAPPTEQAPPTMEMATESSETSSEATKKKKKDKKSLATGSNFLMKKKHMSSMVQKWQKVKIEVEKEDRAKEIKQAAIRRKIEELKSLDKSEK